jgi:hypothetical protein
MISILTKYLDHIHHVVAFLNRTDLKGDRREFQREFKADIEAAMRRPRHAGLQKLEDRINGARLRRKLWIDSFDNPTVGNWPWESVLDFGDEKFRVQDHIGGKGFKKDLYWYLNDALRTGEFAALKKCRQCPNFFASYRRGAFACGPKCNTKFHNKQGRKTGYFTDRYQKEKNRKLKVARSLKGKPLDVIMKRSGLTKWGLIRAGIVAEE